MSYDLIICRVVQEATAFAGSGHFVILYGGLNWPLLRRVPYSGY